MSVVEALNSGLIPSRIELMTIDICSYPAGRSAKKETMWSISWKVHLLSSWKGIGITSPSETIGWPSQSELGHSVLLLSRIRVKY